MQIYKNVSIDNPQLKTIPFRSQNEIEQIKPGPLDFLNKKELPTRDEVQYAKSLPDFTNRDDLSFERKKLTSLSKSINLMIDGCDDDTRKAMHLGNVGIFDSDDGLWTRAISRQPEDSGNDNHWNYYSFGVTPTKIDILLINDLRDSTIKAITSAIERYDIRKAIVRIGNPFDKSNVIGIVMLFERYRLIKFKHEHQGDPTFYISLSSSSGRSSSTIVKLLVLVVQSIDKFKFIEEFGNYIDFCAEEVRKLKQEYNLRYEYARIAGLCRMDAWRDFDWPEVSFLESLGLKLLRKLSNERAIKEMGPMRSSEKTTTFLLEIGWQPTKIPNDKGPKVDFPRNDLIKHLVGDIQKLLPDFDKWRVTDTDPVAIWKTIILKRDIAPVESHGQNELIWAVYDAVKEYLLEKDMKIKFLTKEEAAQTMNRSSSVGANRTMGNFIDSGDYKGQVDHYEKCLFEENPTKSVYNCIAVPERKKDVKHPRLIWTCSGAMRIYETMVLGDMDRVIKSLPYTISGVPKVHYGDELNRIMNPFQNGDWSHKNRRLNPEGQPERHAVCDDISGWDASVSLSLLTMEANVAMALASSQKHKQAIELLYRIYAYSMVTILRPFTGKYAGKKNPEVGHADRVLFQLQGQVASGRRVTYSMNTLTNLVLCMARAAYSYRILPCDAKAWALGNLRRGHTAEFGGKIHGDDSVVIMSPENALKYATLGPKFMDRIGMKLKGVEPGKSSKIARRMEEVDFCSHGFVQVKFPPSSGRSKSVTKWMLARSQTTILAKAELMDEETSQLGSLAAAKGKAYNLLIDYFHDNVIRTLALAILSAVPRGVEYSDRRLKKPRSPLEAVNDNLFYKKGYKIERLDSQVEVISERQAWHDEIDQSDKIYKEWLSMLGYLILDLRERGKVYDDYLPDAINNARSNPDMFRQLKQIFSKATIDRRTIKYLAESGKHSAVGLFQEFLAEPGEVLTTVWNQFGSQQPSKSRPNRRGRR